MIKSKYLKMEKSVEKNVNVYPIFVPGKNIKNLFVPGSFCKDLDTGELFIMSKDNSFINESGQIISIESPEKKLSILLFASDELDNPNPDVAFKINGEWVISSPSDFLGEQIEEAHLISVYPKNIGWNKIEGVVRKFNFDDVKKIIEKNSARVEVECVEIGGMDITNMCFLVEIPKAVENKVVFTI